MKSLETWLESLGYDDSVGVLHRPSQVTPADHPYAREIDLLLRPEGQSVASVGAAAVFEVDRVPAVCFLEQDFTVAEDPEFIATVRQRIWNQNLVSILVVVRGDEATVYPAPRNLSKGPTLRLSEATPQSPFSAFDVASGEIYGRVPQWFDQRHRVDRVLQDNLAESIRRLGGLGADKAQAQLLLGKCIFVSYLEHRGIVGDTYRATHNLGKLLDHLKERDGMALDRLFKRLKADFNGDLLEIEGGFNIPWESLEDEAFTLLADFLLQTRLRDGQASLWSYDFRFIPVELLSGIYESFLSGSDLVNGAVYTPRHLATLAVSQAFTGSERPWEEVVLDGACGSGILLTCAYRTMLGAKRAAQAEPLTYEQRQAILVNGIRGGDISSSACKVTAFSLYLALLEDIAPSDIARLQQDQKVKLPALRGSVLNAEGEGDFFSPNTHIAKPASITIVISNPPWFEPRLITSRTEAPAAQPVPHPYEAWWLNRFSEALPRRQIALAFARRATDALKPGGKLCLILPAHVLSAGDSGPFLRSWFGEMSPERIFNLSDMRHVLFGGADHPTAVIVGTRRDDDQVGTIPVNEHFDYLVPKTDVSLAFGRLTAHSNDRKQLQTLAVASDPELFRTYFWGAQLDESLIARLRVVGTFDRLTRGTNARFVICKGFHMKDSHKEPSPSQPLHNLPFIDLSPAGRHYPDRRLFVTSKDLVPFPKTRIPTVADFGSAQGQAFHGERVIFPDGADNQTLEVRACYTNQPLCFTQSMGAIVDRKGSAELMQFAAAYLRSKLARYLLFYTSFSLTHERPHVKLTEIKNLPFMLPDQHPHPAAAAKVMQEVHSLLKPYRQSVGIEEDPAWLDVRDKLDELVFDYFGLSETERRVVHDTCDFLIPSRQPSSVNEIKRPLQAAPKKDEQQAYADMLESELGIWRERFKGNGFFEVELIGPTGVSNTMGIVRVSLHDKPADIRSISKAALGSQADQLGHVQQVLDVLRGVDGYPQVGDESLSISSDFMLFHGGDYYFVKPQILRLWLASAAAHDALQIVQAARDFALSNAITH